MKSANLLAAIVDSGLPTKTTKDIMADGVNNRSLTVSGTIVLSKEVITYQKDAFVTDHVNNSIVPLRCNKKCIQD